MKMINGVLTAKGRDITVIFNCLNSQFATLLRLTSDKEMLHCALQNTENKEKMLGYIRELLDLNQLMCSYDGEIPEDCTYKPVLDKDMRNMLLKMTDEDYFRMITTMKSPTTGKTILES